MNKAIFTSFAILCLLFMLLIMECKISVNADPVALYVDDDNVTGPWDGTKAHPCQNITDALERTTDGDTIFVYKGMYYEHVIVGKSVSLVGEDKNLTIVDGNRTGSVISVTANNVNICGFTIRHSGKGYYDSGIYVDHSSGNNINSNVITSNNGGISLYSSGNNVVSGNVISSNNYDGIVFYSSANNVVSGNVISSNGDYGMYLALYSGNNTVYFNNFNNAYQVSSESMNLWDNGNEGNYWSDYTGQDLNGDGIGDTAYVIDVNNQDNHPLMGMFSEFNIILEGKTYHVTTICNSTLSEFRFEVGPETGNKIIRFNVTGKDSTEGFMRIMIPTELMDYPYIVLADAEEIAPTLLDISNETYAHLYFTYHSSQTIAIISSKTLHLYNELYNELLDKYLKLQTDLYNLNATYHGHLNDYRILLGNYSQLLDRYNELNSFYQELLLDYYENVYNIRNLMYIFAATTAIFIITVIYLSRQAHTSKTSARTS